MITTIENYRGIEIWFDTAIESFQCDIDDERSIKKSYAAIKKFIDDWKKDNEKFKPFKVIKNPNNDYYGKEGIITGIRKDNRFVIELTNGKLEQISDYDEDRYILYETENEELISKLDALKIELKEFQEKNAQQQKYIISQMNLVTLKEYKKQLLTDK